MPVGEILDDEKKRRQTDGQWPGDLGNPSSNLVLKLIFETVRRSDLGADAKLIDIFEAGLAYRVAEIANKLLPDLGETVRGGPFAGMTYTGAVAEGCIVPKLLGCYEQELQSKIKTIQKCNIDAIINIGCAEGYYAVGMAHLMPGVMVHAYDTNENARQRCRELAERNGVADRVRIGQTIGADGFSACEGRHILIICDIEGEEFALLNPVQAPALLEFDLLVELHPIGAETVEAFTKQFAATHEVEIIQPAARNPEAFTELASLSPLDKSLALIERLAPTPWVFLQARQR
jgi:hypothetical protein